jgi:branched-chain amino acid transport system permease protein
MVSTFVMYSLVTALFLGAAIPGAIAIAVVIGIVIQFLMERVEGDHHREVFLSVGIAIILENILLAYYGGIYRFGPNYLSGVIEFGDIRLATYRLIIFGITITLFVILSLIVTRTRLGRSMRAVSQSEEAAWLMGIDVYRTKLITAGLAGGVAATAAVLLLPIYPIYPAMGWTYLLIGFAIVILGGMGSLNGTLIGGIILGASESLFGYYVSSGLRGALYFVAIIAMILIRPQGLLGKKEK